MNNNSSDAWVDPDGETRPFLPDEELNFSDPNLIDDQAKTQPVKAVEPVSPYYSYPSYPQSVNNPEEYTQAYQSEDPISYYQPISVTPPPVNAARQAKRPKPSRQPGLRRTARRGGLHLGCGCMGFLLILFVALAYLLMPLPTHVLVLGLDRALDGSSLSRTDTIILVSVNPLQPDIKMLSIPRDLWIDIPGVGENRINTVHYFAEAQQPGSGPEATLQVVNQTFHVSVPYYVRVRFDAVVGIVDAMGGVNVDMPEAMSGYEAGTHHLDGTQALAFARDRKGADDFFRMAHGQLLIKSVVRQMLNPLSWVRLPQITAAVFKMVDTNLPVWQWPRVGLALARAVLSGGIDSRTLDRDMATPFITSGGASVLIPHWDLITPLVRQMFGS